MHLRKTEKKHNKIDVTISVITSWDYEFYQELFRSFGPISAFFEIFFYFLLKYFGEFEESLLLRAGSSLMALGFYFIPSSGSIKLWQKIYIEATYFVGLPLTFYILMILNHGNTYWFASMAFCGCIYGLLSFQLAGIFVFLLISVTIFFTAVHFHDLNSSINNKNLLLAHAVWSITFLLSSLVRIMLQLTYRKLLDLNTEIAKANVLEQSYEKLKNREEVIKKFISPLILNEIELGENPVSFIPKIVNCNILFTDMRNYTKFSENNTLQNNYDVLNKYFVQINNSIVSHDGRIDKLIGDSVMAVFENSRACLNACIDIRLKIAEQNRSRVNKGLSAINFGVGISYGEVLYANFGSEEKYDRTVIGDVVNISARLENLTKDYKVDILVSEKFIEQVNDYKYVRLIGQVKLRGRNQYESIYEVFGHNRDEVLDWKISTRGQLEKVNRWFVNNNIRDSIRLINKLINDCPVHSYFPEKIMDLTLIEIKKRIMSSSGKKRSKLYFRIQ